MTLQSETLSSSTVRFAECKSETLTTSLNKCHGKNVTPCKLLRRTNLHGKNTTKGTMRLEFESDLDYTPGDHIGIMPVNRKEIVDKILEKLKGVDDFDKPMELQLLKETHTSNGNQFYII